MITKDKAIAIAEDYISEIQKSTRYNIVLLLDALIEFELGWVFFYDSKTYIETGDMLEMLIGNTPIIIDKRNGSITKTGSAYPIEKYINDYRTQHKNDSMSE